MQINRYECPGCGSTLLSENINLKTREASCDFCGLRFFLPKKHSTASPNAVIALDEAVKQFLNGNLESAKNYAENVLSMTTNNAAALYIVGYYQCYGAEIKADSSLKRLFDEVLPFVEFDIEEENVFKELILKTIHHSNEYQKQILKRFAEYDDSQELATFVEQFAPFVILNQNDFDWFDEEMAYIYLSIAEKCSIPKTTYALISFLLKCKTSPLVGNTFYLITRAQKIYNNYLLKIKEIIFLCKDESSQSKFNDAINKIESVYLKKLNEAKEE